MPISHAVKALAALAVGVDALKLTNPTGVRSHVFRSRVAQGNTEEKIKWDPDVESRPSEAVGVLTLTSNRGGQFPTKEDMRILAEEALNTGMADVEGGKLKVPKVLLFNFQEVVELRSSMLTLRGAIKRLRKSFKQLEVKHFRGLGLIKRHHYAVKLIGGHGGLLSVLLEKIRDTDDGTTNVAAVSQDVSSLKSRLNPAAKGAVGLEMQLSNGVKLCSANFHLPSGTGVKYAVKRDALLKKALKSELKWMSNGNGEKWSVEKESCGVVLAQGDFNYRNAFEGIHDELTKIENGQLAIKKDAKIAQAIVKNYLGRMSQRSALANQMLNSKGQSISPEQMNLFTRTDEWEVLYKDDQKKPILSEVAPINFLPTYKIRHEENGSHSKISYKHKFGWTAEAQKKECTDAKCVQELDKGKANGLDHFPAYTDRIFRATSSQSGFETVKYGSLPGFFDKVKDFKVRKDIDHIPVFAYIEITS
jgi:hypothetical protein